MSPFPLTDPKSPDPLVLIGRLCFILGANITFGAIFGFICGIRIEPTALAGIVALIGALFGAILGVMLFPVTMLLVRRPLICVVLVLLCAGIAGLVPSTGSPNANMLLTGALVMAGTITAIFIVPKSWPPPPPTHCPACSYDLRGLPFGSVCPECGGAKKTPDPSDRASNKS